MSKANLALGLAAAIVAIAVTAWLVWSVFLPEAASERHDQDIASREMVQAAALAIRDRFPNAQSTTFVSVVTHGVGGSLAVCGTVDIEDANNAFQGPERFVYAGDELTLEEADGSPVVEQRWRDVCEG